MTCLSRKLLEITLISLLAAGESMAAQVELTFDDVNDEVGGPIRNKGGDPNFLAGDDPEFCFSIELKKGATRSGINDGYWGRAAEFHGGEEHLLIRWDRPGCKFDPRVFQAMVWAEDAGAGWIYRAYDGSSGFGIRMSEGRLVASGYADGAWSDRGFFLDVQGQQPADTTVPTGEWVHLKMTAGQDPESGKRGIMLVVNFGDPIYASLMDMPVVEDPFPERQVTLGLGMTGRIDEPLLHSPSHGWTYGRDYYDPDFCSWDPALSCHQDLFTMSPEGRPDLVVPVIVKTIWDPAQCNRSSPCPLLFQQNGGGACSNGNGLSHRAARQGFVAAGLHVYCESYSPAENAALGIKGGWPLYPRETSQAVAAKNYLLNDSPVGELVKDRSCVEPAGCSDAACCTRYDAFYSATGGSHGANMVKGWALMEDDYPDRTWSRSASDGIGAHCRVHEVFCPNMVKQIETAHLGTSPHDDLDPFVIESFSSPEMEPMNDRVDADIVKTREFAATWGVQWQSDDNHEPNPGRPLCREDGHYQSFEEGIGFTATSRQLRDRWLQAQEAAGANTGYFMEWIGTNNQHGAPNPDLHPEYHECMYCFLKHGRANMDAQCPECVDHLNRGDDPDNALYSKMRFGLPAPECSCWDDPECFPCLSDCSSEYCLNTEEDICPGSGGGHAGEQGCASAPGPGGGVAALLFTALLLAIRRRV